MVGYRGKPRPCARAQGSLKRALCNCDPYNSKRDDCVRFVWVSAMWCAFRTDFQSKVSGTALEHRSVCPRQGRSESRSTHGPPHPRPIPAPKGHATVATGEAQRNPWYASRSNHPAPEGRTDSSLRGFRPIPVQCCFVRPSGAVRIVALDTTGCAALHPWLFAQAPPGQINAKSMTGQFLLNAR